MDWKKLLSDISTLSATQKETADFCGCSQSTISELSRGEIKEPSHSLGEKLIEFYEQLQTQQLAAARSKPIAHTRRSTDKETTR